MDDVGVTSEPLIDVDPPPGEESKDVKPAPVAEEQKADTPAATDENAEIPEEKKESRRQRKLQRERDARIAAETEARLLREQLAERDKQAKPQEAGEPKRDQFESYEDYLEARADWRADQKINEALKTRDEASKGKDAESQKREAHERLTKNWTEREKAVISKTPDYEETVTPYVDVDGDLGQLSNGARQMIVESEVGPDVLHHLATHQADHDRIAKLSPLRQLVELGKLEDSLASKDDEPKPEGKKISSAPPPLKPVSGGKSASQGYRENMTDSEYKEWRKGQGAAWAR